MVRRKRRNEQDEEKKYSKLKFYSENMEIAVMLVKHGADVNKEDYLGR